MVGAAVHPLPGITQCCMSVTQCTRCQDTLFFLLISRRVDSAANTDTGLFNFWVWVAGGESTARRHRYR